MLDNDVDWDLDDLQVTGATALHGEVAINADGTLTYTPNANYNSADTITYEISDGQGGTATAAVAVTVTPVNDAALLSSGDETAAETNAALVLSGTLTNSDVDNDDTFVAQAGTVGTYGTFAIDAAGAWTFTANSAFDELNVGDAHTETFAVAATDGTPTSVKVTITGTNDAALLSSGDETAAETNAALVLSGTLTNSDVDNDDTFVAQAGTVGTYGTFAIDAAGAWTFTANSAFDEFNVGDAHTETFAVAATDGTPTSVKVTITGTNDAANDLIFSFTGSPGNSLPDGSFGQISLIDPDGGAQPYTFSSTGLTATTLTGGAASDFAGDLTVSTAGVISASNLDDDRVYELTIQVAQGAAVYSETFSIITGTNSGDSIGGSFANGDDVIFAQGAADIILAGSGNDTVFGQAAADQITGGTGNDTLNGAGGDDIYSFAVGDGIDTISDSGNTDTIVIADSTLANLSFERVGTSLIVNYGSSDQITVTGNFSGSRVENIEFSGGSVFGYDLGTSSRTLDTDLAGSNNDDVLAGTSATETLIGGAGNDLMFGNGENDSLTGGSGTDLLLGGDGADTFVFTSTSDSIVGARDVIGDFVHGTDKIDLFAVDAVTQTGSGNQAFAFAGQNAGTVANSITWEQVGGNTVVRAMSTTTELPTSR